MPTPEFDVIFADECLLYYAGMILDIARNYGLTALPAVLAVLFAGPAAQAQWHYVTNNEPEGLPTLQGESGAAARESLLQPEGVQQDVIAQAPAEPAADPCEEPAEEAPEVADLAKALNPSTVCDDPLTFTPGLRIQPRYDFEGNNNNNDFFIRRFRLKGSGSAYGVAKYGVELKIDSTSRFEASPSASVENAWLDFPVVTDLAYLRAGLYDIPFSLNALTSDSKLLLMDRTLIKEALTGIGFADNTVGVMLHGRPDDGRWEYAMGIFDNVFFEKVGTAGTRETDELQPAGRIGFALLDPFPAPDGYADYKGSYLGQGQRLNLGFNAVRLGEAVDAAVEFDHLAALGTDLFFNSGPYVFQSEFDWFVEDIVGDDDIKGTVGTCKAATSSAAMAAAWWRRSHATRRSTWTRTPTRCVGLLWASTTISATTI